MTCTTNLHIARTFSRTDTSAPKGHPVRSHIRKPLVVADEPRKPLIVREHLLQHDEETPAQRRAIVIRDTVISIMGAISAMVPILIAIQSATGA